MHAHLSTQKHCSPGLGLRMPITFLVMYGSGFNIREKLFFALSWSPKVAALPFVPCLCAGPVLPSPTLHTHIHMKYTPCNPYSSV